MVKPVYLLLGVLFFLSLLPRPLRLGLGRIVSGFFRITKPRFQKSLFTNIEICDSWLRERVPNYNPDTFVVQASRVYMQNALEYGPMLFHSKKAVDARCDQDSHNACLRKIEELREMGRGVILICAHVGNTEYIAHLLSRIPPCHFIYSASGQKTLEHRLTSRREKIWDLKKNLANKKGAYQVLQALRAGEAVAMLADHKSHAPGSMVSAPFMGVNALSPVLLPALARRTKAPALGVAVVPNAAGKLQILTHAVSQDLQSEDRVVAVREQNRVIEELIAQAPLHYAWPYRRYGHTPDHPHSPYR